jgi:hypothetical protein
MIESVFVRQVIYRQMKRSVICYTQRLQSPKRDIENRSSHCILEYVEISNTCIATSYMPLTQSRLYPMLPVPCLNAWNSWKRPVCGNASIVLVSSYMREVILCLLACVFLSPVVKSNMPMPMSGIGSIYGLLILRPGRGAVVRRRARSRGLCSAGRRLLRGRF